MMREHCGLAVWTAVVGLVVGACSPEAAEAQQAAAAGQTTNATQPPAGHSMHGEVFNEGPRQAAYLTGNTGNVHLAVTSNVPQVQQFFDQGVGQLHGFWYFESERSFRQAAALDPDCAMAYWGMAMANFNNSNRAKGFIQKAVERKPKATRREQLWIDGLNAYLTATGDAKNRWQTYIRSLEQITYEFPDELEAKAFLAWAIWSAKGNVPVPSHVAVSALIDDVLGKNPFHPVHHYKIHLWDGERPEQALPSAARCGQSAPGVAHMWHMSGHIYWKVHRYHDSAYEQEASARTDHARMIRDRTMPYQIHNYSHNNEWLIRSLSNIGRVHEAITLAKNLIEIPRHPSLNRVENGGSCAGYGRQRLFEVLNRYELWDEIIRLCDSMYLEPTASTTEQVKRLRALGAAHFGKGDVDKGRQEIADLQKRLNDVRTKQDAAGNEAEKKAREANKPDAEITKAKNDARNPLNGQVRELENALHDLQGRLAMTEGKFDEALKLLSQASGVLKEHLAQFHLAAGRNDRAVQLAEEAKRSGVNEVYPLANYVDILHRCGKKHEAQKALAELWPLASDVDLDLPVFQRVAAFLAKELNITGDWRLPRTLPSDLGERPPLATLGPLRWQPAAAPEWTLFDSACTPASLEGFHDRPVVVIFYLGYSCLHCVQQLEKFAPMSKQFHDAGIDLVAISTDSLDAIQKSVDRFRKESAEPQEFPIRLFADPDLEIFKKYRVFDDFERSPLHGTFMIDGAGKIRWQEISFQPFMDPAFVLEEAKRLLKTP
jgi:peroxiredoxin/tetratricopeptide (TPR) repeat protein